MKIIVALVFLALAAARPEQPNELLESPKNSVDVAASDQEQSVAQDAIKLTNTPIDRDLFEPVSFVNEATNEIQSPVNSDEKLPEVQIVDEPAPFAAEDVDGPVYKLRFTDSLNQDVDVQAQLSPNIKMSIVDMRPLIVPEDVVRAAIEAADSENPDAEKFVEFLIQELKPIEVPNDVQSSLYDDDKQSADAEIMKLDTPNQIIADDILSVIAPSELESLRIVDLPVYDGPPGPVVDDPEVVYPEILDTDVKTLWR